MAKTIKTKAIDKPKPKTEAEIEADLSPAEVLVRRIGRPSKYDPKHCAEIIAWFMVDKYEKVVVERHTKFNKEGGKSSETEKYKLIPCDLPTLEGFARHIGVGYDTMYGWAHEFLDDKAEVPAKKYPEFSKAYNIAKQLQKEFLVDNGLKGNYPPASYIFTAKNITDMADTQVIENKDTQLKEKQDALTEWFDSLRHDAKLADGAAPANEATVPDIQED